MLGNAEKNEDSNERDVGETVEVDFTQLDVEVAEKLKGLLQTGKLDHTDLDKRVLDALRESPADVAKLAMNHIELCLTDKKALIMGLLKLCR